MALIILELDFPDLASVCSSFFIKEPFSWFSLKKYLLFHFRASCITLWQLLSKCFFGLVHSVIINGNRAVLDCSADHPGSKHLAKAWQIHSLNCSIKAVRSLLITTESRDLQISEQWMGQMMAARKVMHQGWLTLSLYTGPYANTSLLPLEL